MLRRLWLVLVGAAVVLGIAGDRVRPQSHSAKPAATTDSFTLYLLGGSTALGEPYAPQTDLGRIASILLGGQCEGHPIAVVNLGKRGKPAEQVVADAQRISRDCRDPGATAAFLYVGNNQFLCFDRRPDLRHLPRALCDEPVVSSSERDEVLRRYRSSYATILRSLRARGIEVIAATTAVNLADWEPNRSVLMRRENAPRVKALLQESEARSGRGDIRGALNSIHELLRLVPEFALGCKRAGDLYRQLGDAGKARRSYQQAVDFDGNPQRELSQQNAIVRQECERAGVSVVDAERIVMEQAADGLVGDNLMWDNCHPRLEAYAAIAHGFASKLCEARGLPPPSPPPDRHQLERMLGIGPTVQRRILHERGQYCYGAATLTFDPRQRLERARRYLEAAMALGPEEADLICSIAVLDALEGDVQRSLAHWRRAYRLDASVTRERASNRYVAQILERHGLKDSMAALDRKP